MTRAGPDHESDAIFAALADPTRRAILGIIGTEGEATAGDIARQTEGVGRTAVSGHLRVLRLAGLVSERRAGRYRYYSLTASPADAVVAFLTSVYRHSLQDLANAVSEASGAAERMAESG